MMHVDQGADCDAQAAAMNDLLALCDGVHRGGADQNVSMISCAVPQFGSSERVLTVVAEACDATAALLNTVIDEWRELDAHRHASMAAPKVICAFETTLFVQFLENPLDWKI